MGHPAPPAASARSDDLSSTRDPADTDPNGAAIWARIRARAEQQLTVVELQAHRLLDRALTDDEIAAATDAATALGRGLGSLQEHSCAQLARHIAARLAEPSMDATTGVHIAGAIEDLRTMLEGAITQLESAPPHAGTVFAIGNPDARFDAVLWVLASRGHRIRALARHLRPQGDDAHVVVDRRPPDHDAASRAHHPTEPAAIIAAVGRSLSPSMRTVLQAAAETYRTPITVLHDEAPVAVQRELATYGATLLPLAASPDEVFEETVRHRAARDARLEALLCGAGGAGRVLEAHGFEITTVPIAEDMLDVAVHGNTAVVFGGDVPPELALDMARLIRATPVARRAPIVWQGDHDEVTRLRAEQLGIMVGHELDDGVAVRIAAQMRAAVADASPMMSETGALLGWPTAQLLIDRSLVAAQRHATATSVATVTIDDTIDDDHLAQIAEALTREFRRSDVVCRRDDRRFAVALHGAPRRVCVNRMSALASRFAPEGRGVRVGVAEFPGDGRSADELVAAADSAVRRAIAAGGPSVVPTTWRPVSERAIDVLIVDPDPVLGELIASLLTDRGHRCRLLTDGRDALDELVDSATDVLPRLLVLEIDVSGIDGLTLLRSLRPSGVLSQMNVLVVTARAAEADMRLALDLGATDVIRKPFSTTLLTHRAGRLLER